VPTHVIVVTGRRGVHGRACAVGTTWWGGTTNDIASYSGSESALDRGRGLGAVLKETTFVDLFSGCGGLSLGLSMAGLRGLFAVEKDGMAFDTFAANLLDNEYAPVKRFAWPKWLPKRAWAIDDLLDEHKQNLLGLRGKVDVLAGGPPCQGFSFAGRRVASDPRNLLFEKYVEVVDAIQPSALILENVPGMKVAHAVDSNSPQRAESFLTRLKAKLSAIGYDVQDKIVDASSFGVPQRRSRLIVVGLRRDVALRLATGPGVVFENLERVRLQQLVALGLSDAVTAEDALSDLAIGNRKLQGCSDVASPPSFYEVAYRRPRTAYQKLMNSGVPQSEMDSMRLANHREDIRERFARLLAECPKGVRLSEDHRRRFGLKKHRIYLMSPYEPGPTITTLPDDVLHYSEPRILTVRECARLQSFPDWFVFRGKYTTGGTQRTKECPRYTQVGNAVPPYLARALGQAILATLSDAQSSKAKTRNAAKGELQSAA
jgi:DNA (cytosine-5)-methyltransferase 1